MNIAVTLLSAYQYCPRKLYLQKVMKLKTEPTEALVKGKIRHKIEEELTIRFNYIISKVTQGDLVFIKDLFKQEYLNIVRRTVINNMKLIIKVDLNIQNLTSELIDTFSTISRQAAEVIHDIVIKHNVLGKKILDFIEEEQSTELFIESDTLKLKGIVDSIEYNDDYALPVELKTGSMPVEGVWPSHKLQLGCYILLCKEKFPDKIVDKGIVRYLDYDKDREIQMNPFLRDEIFSIRDKVIELLNSKEIPPTLSIDKKHLNKKCINCQFLNECYIKF